MCRERFCTSSAIILTSLMKSVRNPFVNIMQSLDKTEILFFLFFILHLICYSGFPYVSFN